MKMPNHSRFATALFPFLPVFGQVVFWALAALAALLLFGCTTTADGRAARKQTTAARADVAGIRKDADAATRDAGDVAVSVGGVRKSNAELRRLLE